MQCIFPKKRKDPVKRQFTILQYTSKVTCVKYRHSN